MLRAYTFHSADQSPQAKQWASQALTVSPDLNNDTYLKILPVLCSFGKYPKQLYRFLRSGFPNNEKKTYI